MDARAPISALRRPSRSTVQSLALLAAALLAFNGARILNDSPTLSRPVLKNFDEAALWLGLALLALLVATMPPLSKLSMREWPAAAAAFWRAHRLEIAFFVLIFAFGVFMRVYRFGSTLPPSNGLCCEEHINGGVAYKALLGDRPLNFLITRWGAAGGFLIFGENTLGLRFFFVVMSILTLVAFYFLLRQLVSVQAALFGFSLYAAAWWPALRARQATEGTIYAVLFAALFVRALKTKSPFWALCAGVLTGLLSYEYEPYKAVPIIAALFLGAAAAREVLLRVPIRLDAARDRARTLFSVAWRPMIIALVACGVVLVPMVVGTHKGYDLYLTSVHRQESDRSGNRFADNWRSQLKWAGEIFLPFGPNEYVASPPRDIPQFDLIDPVAGWLALAGMIMGIIFALRGVRALFVMWVVLSLGAAALLLSDFGPWKFIGLVPVVITLAAIFVDDVRGLVKRLWGNRGVQALAVLLVVAAAYAFWSNADTLFNDIAPSDSLAIGYGGNNALFYSVCDYLRDRGDNNHTIVASGTGSITKAFAARRTTYAEQTRAWGDFIWVCHDLKGSALPSEQEAWPLRDLPDGPITLVFADPLLPVDQVIVEVNRAYPGLGAPDKVGVGPAETYRFIAYEFASPKELAQPGLWGEYLPLGGSAGGAQPTSRADDVSNLSWEASPPPIDAPVNVHWQGVIYIDQQTTATLRALTDFPVAVQLDGQMVYSTLSGQPQESFVDLLPGWHPIEIVLQKQNSGGSVRLRRVTGDNKESAVASEDLFPLKDLSGWLHTRTTGFPGGLQQHTSQRLDFSPHYSALDGERVQAQPGDFEPQLQEERWRGVWHVDVDGAYTLDFQFQAGTATLLVDGLPVVTGETQGSQTKKLEALVPLTAGPHTIEIVQAIDNAFVWSGAVLAASRDTAGGTRDVVAMRVTPY